MVNPLLAVGGLNLASGLLSGSSARQQERDKRNQIKLMNLSTIRETAQEISGIMVEQALLRRNMSQARNNATRAGLLGSASAETIAGASGVRGASVDAVISDIDRELGQTKDDLAANSEIESFNITQRIRSLASARKAQLMTPNAVRSSGDVFSGALTGALLNTGSMYANQLFSFGGSKQ